MNCPVCKGSISGYIPTGAIRLATPTDGVFELHDVCESCCGKLIDFLAALGWLPKHFTADKQE